MRPVGLYTFLLLFFICMQQALYAGDEKPASAIPWYNLQMLESPYSFATQYADTTHQGFQLYDFFLEGDPFVANRGNVGHASRKLRFAPDLSSGFSLFPADPYMHYRFMHDHLRFYRPEHVFTDIFYVTGSNREQLFYGKHAQRFQENIYATANYRLVNSPGEFSRLGSRNSNVYATFDYRDPGERYQLLASFVSNRFENQESGGLKNHLGYEENPVRDSVFMYNAMSRYRETAINLTHFYRTGFFIGDQEEETEAERRFVNLGRINHDLSYVRRSYVFEEGSSPVDFYQASPVMPTSTFDSTMVQTLENQISWSNFPMERDGGSFPFNFRLSMTHRYVNIQQPLLAVPGEDEAAADESYQMDKQTFNQFIPAVFIESDRNRVLSFDGHTTMTIGGYNDEDFDFGGNIYLGRQEELNRFQASVFFYLREAPYFLSRFSGNYISWDHDYEKMNILRFSGKWHHKLFGIEASYYLLNNMVFMNGQALPEQNDQAFSVMTAGISARPGIGILQSRHQLLLQYASSDQYERFPSFISYHSIFADFSLFDKALFANIGFDLTYNAPYKPMAYMPVVRQFYAQNDYDSGHVFLLDAFLTAKVKRTRFFLRFQNVLGMITGGLPVYSIPYYPLPEAAFKLGISWMFFN
jgi:hypothetical protein